MAAVNRHRRETGFPGTMINDDLEEGDSDFTTHCNYPLKVDSACIINILGLLEQAVFINDNKNWDDSYVCGEWSGHICCKSTLFKTFFAGTKFYFWSSKSYFSLKFCVVCFVTDSKTIDTNGKFHGNKDFVL